MPDQTATSPAATPSLAQQTSLGDLSDETLFELIHQRRRHGFIRVASVLAMAITAIALVRLELVPATWGAVLLYGVPIATLIFGDHLLVAQWRRRARSQGVSDEALDALRAHLRALPPDRRQSGTDDLVRFVKWREQQA